MQDRFPLEPGTVPVKFSSTVNQSCINRGRCRGSRRRRYPKGRQQILVRKDVTCSRSRAGGCLASDLNWRFCMCHMLLQDSNTWLVHQMQTTKPTCNILNRRSALFQLQNLAAFLHVLQANKPDRVFLVAQTTSKQHHQRCLPSSAA